MLLAALILLAAVAVVSVDAAIGLQRIAWLADLPRAGPAGLPRLSVVVAARNEAPHLRAALESLLAQDYPALEIVAVNDRSEDETGAILAGLAAAHSRLRVVTVQALPAGWLGKNHALAQGAASASGAFLLFTDADVIFAPGALRRAMGYVSSQVLDHLAVAPAITSHSRAVRVFVAGFAIFFGLLTQPWRVRDPRSRAAVGIGAFNLVRRTAYEAAGGHRPIRLRPDDDLMLGRLLKRAGARSDMLFGAGALSVDWYGNLRDLTNGLLKNSFAGAGYSVPAVVAAAAMLVLLAIGPPAGVLLTEGLPRLTFAMTTAILLGAAMLSARTSGLAPALGLALPLSLLLFAYILLRSTAVTLWRGGIEWRGTFYPLAELRRNRL